MQVRSTYEGDLGAGDATTSPGLGKCKRVTTFCPTPRRHGTARKLSGHATMSGHNEVDGTATQCNRNTVGIDDVLAHDELKTTI